MDPEEEIPERSSLWFSEQVKAGFSGQLLNQITVVFSVVLALFSLIIFWPLVSQINFEEAFFTPLVPLVIEMFATFNFEPVETMRILFTASFVVSTVGIYLLVKDLTRRQMTSTLAALIYIIPPVPIFVLNYVRRGLYESELQSASSFLGIVYGDGAHFLALAVIPFALIFYARYLKFAKKIDFVVSVILCSLILLINRSQAFNLFLILTTFTLTEAFLGLARIKIRRFLLVLMFGVGLVFFWYTPAFWISSLEIARGYLLTNFKYFFPLPAILLAISLFFSFVFFARRQERQPIFFAFLLFIIFLGITSDWLVNQRVFVPHPQRLLSNLNMFFSIVASLSITAVIDRLQLVQRFNFETWALPVRILGALAFGVVSFVFLVAFAFFFSPLAILAVSGQGGVWHKIRDYIVSDRQEVLEAAGGYFKLVRTDTAEWSLWMGISLSLSFLVALMLLIFKDWDYRQKRNDG